MPMPNGDSFFYIPSCSLLFCFQSIWARVLVFCSINRANKDELMDAFPGGLDNKLILQRALEI